MTGHRVVQGPGCGSRSWLARRPEQDPQPGTGCRGAWAWRPRAGSGQVASPPACTCVRRLFLENGELEHSEDEGSVLGQGGSGTVIYRARYHGQPVAVKRFQIKKFKNFANVPAGNGAPRRVFQTCAPSVHTHATSGRPEATARGRRR